MAEPRYRPAARQRPGSAPTRRRQRRSVPTEAIPALPPGFQLEPEQQAPQTPDVPDVPPLPPGFVLESGDEAKPEKKNPEFDIMKTGMDMAHHVLKSTADYFVGKEDPKFGKLPSIDEPETAADAGLQFGALNRGKVAGATDESYMGIIKKQLGNRFIGVEKDANGASVITYLGAKGQPQKAYLNKPGLDLQDVDRGISSALPYMAAGGAVSKLGGGLLAQAGAQTIGQGATSVAQDVAAGKMGSEAGIDPIKGALSAAGGGIGTFAAPALKALIGKKPPIDPKWVGKDGRLTQFAQKKLALEYPGLNTTALGKHETRDFGRKVAQAEDPIEAYLKTQADHFGIETSRYQRTRNNFHGTIENDLKTDTLGAIPGKRFRDFTTRQKQKISDVVRGSQFNPPATAGVNSPPTPATDGFAATLAPHRTFFDQGRDTLGGGVQKGFLEAQKNMKGRENAAWGQVNDMAPKAGATESIGGFVADKLGPRGNLINEKTTPVAYDMVQAIIAFKSGKEIPSNISELVGRQGVRYVDEMRRVLGKYIDSAAPGPDRIAAGKIYSGFRDWIDAAAEKNLLSGRATDAINLRNAIDTTKQVQGLLKPLFKGKKTATARVLEKVEHAGTGSEALTALLGTSGPRGEFARGGVQAIKTYKRIVLENGGDVGKGAWNDLRLAYWMKAVTNDQGMILDAGHLRNNIRSMLYKQKEVATTFFSPKEIREMRKLVDALDVVAAPPVNASGSAAGIRNLFPKLAQESLRSQSQREKFVKGNIMIGNIWRLLASSVPFLEKVAGGNVFKAATSQQIARKSAQNSGAGIGGAVGAVSSNNRDR